MNIDNLCMSCMNELYGEKQCPKCGYYVDSPQISPYLPLRSPVGEKYIVGKVISSNSEGATYMAYDVERKNPVVIREFLPERFIDRNFNSPEVRVNEQWRDLYYVYLKKFLDLWRSLARVRGLSALIPVIDIIECNNTAYVVMEHIESITLRDFLLKSQTGYLNWEKAKVLFMPVLSTLSTLHNIGIVHYGLNPDNLLIGRDGKLRISGFSIAEARLEGSELMPELFDGYSPIEQYNYNSESGPWTDVYSFCAVVYRALVGSVPQDAVSRSVNDKLIIPARYAEIIPVYVINALMNGLQIDPADRTRDVEILREELSATPSNVVSSFSGVNVPPPEKGTSPEPAVTVEEDSSTGKTILITCLVFVAIGLVVFGVLAGYRHFSNKAEDETTAPTVQEEDMIEVPNFVNSSYDMISQNPVQNERFKIKSVMEYSTEVEKGNIISQSLKEGTKVARGTEITFVVSRGPEYVTVPQGLTGNMIDFVKSELEGKGFAVKVIEKSNDGTHEEGEVIDITPKEGTSLVKGTEVYVQVWGAPPETEPATEEPESTTRKSIFDFGFFG